MSRYPRISQTPCALSACPASSVAGILLDNSKKKDVGLPGCDVITASPKVMGSYKNSLSGNIIPWLLAAIASALNILMLIDFLRQ
jgi:hypothetical protein